MQSTRLLQLMQQENKPLIIDVRSQYEFKQAHIPGAVHIPFWQSFFHNTLDKVAKDQEIVLYCQHGPRAHLAEFMLKLSGYQNIQSLEGHFSAWQQQQLPVESN